MEKKVKAEYKLLGEMTFREIIDICRDSDSCFDCPISKKDEKKGCLICRANPQSNFLTDNNDFREDGIIVSKDEEAHAQMEDSSEPSD